MGNNMRNTHNNENYKQLQANLIIAVLNICRDTTRKEVFEKNY